MQNHLYLQKYKCNQIILQMLQYYILQGSLIHFLALTDNKYFNLHQLRIQILIEDILYHLRLTYFRFSNELGGYSDLNKSLIPPILPSRLVAS